MTNVPLETGKTEYWTVITGDGFPFSFVISWGIAVAVLVGAVALSLWWFIKKTPNRDPTLFAGYVIVQMLLFLLLNTVAGIQWMTGSVACGSPDPELWYLSIAQVVGSLLGNITLCMFALATVMIASRRLPRITGATVFPIAVVLLDVTSLLMWTTHVLMMRK